MTENISRPEGDSPEYWEQHWAQFAEATRLNPAQMFRRTLIFKLLGPSANHPTATILDVGCGSGDQLAALGTRYPLARLAGIDRSKTGLSVTARSFPNALLLAADLEHVRSFPEQLNDWASHAVCSEVLEHVNDPIVALKNLKKCLKPGGYLAITVPGGPKSAFDRSIGHQRHFTAEQLRANLDTAGYQVDLTASTGFPTFNLYRLVVILRGSSLGNDIGGHPNLAARIAMAMFRQLLKFWVFNSPWGWQIVALARRPLEQSG